MDRTVTEIVEGAVAGSQEDFAELVERSWSRLVGVARSIIGDGQAEDVVQDALVHAWQSLSSLRTPSAFPSWITRVVVRACLRQRRRPRPVPLEAVTESRDEPRIDPRSRAGSGFDVARLLGALAPRQRAVLHLTVALGMSDREIGEVMDIAPASVRAHRRRAREALARLLGSVPGSGLPDTGGAQPHRGGPLRDDGLQDDARQNDAPQRNAFRGNAP